MDKIKSVIVIQILALRIVNDLIKKKEVIIINMVQNLSKVKNNTNKT